MNSPESDNNFLLISKNLDFSCIQGAIEMYAGKLMGHDRVYLPNNIRKQPILASDLEFWANQMKNLCVLREEFVRARLKDEEKV